jgi:hypothetical protein
MPHSPSEKAHLIADMFAARKRWSRGHLPTVNPIRLVGGQESGDVVPMWDLCRLVVAIVTGPFRVMRCTCARQPQVRSSGADTAVLSQEYRHSKMVFIRRLFGGEKSKRAT